MKKKRKIIIFDFDGVIVNTCQVTFEINREVIPDFKYEEFQDWHDGNFFKIEKKKGENYKYGHYLERYQERIHELLPEEGMEEVFKELMKKGYELIIVSSSIERVINDFLEKNNLEKYFIEVMARDTHFSKVEKFKLIFKKYGIKAKETLIITDSSGDVREAEEVKMKSIGVTWGIHGKERLKESGASFVVEKVEDIVLGIKKVLALN